MCLTGWRPGMQIRREIEKDVLIKDMDLYFEISGDTNHFSN